MNTKATQLWVHSAHSLSTGIANDGAAGLRRQVKEMRRELESLRREVQELRERVDNGTMGQGRKDEKCILPLGEMVTGQDRLQFGWVTVMMQILQQDSERLDDSFGECYHGFVIEDVTSSKGSDGRESHHFIK